MTSRKHYIKGQAWCNYDRRVVSTLAYSGRCPICMRKGKWLTKLEDYAKHPEFEPGHLYLEDGRIIHQETGEIVNAYGRLVDRTLTADLLSFGTEQGQTLFDVQGDEF